MRVWGVGPLLSEPLGETQNAELCAAQLPQQEFHASLGGRPPTLRPPSGDAQDAEMCAAQLPQ